MIIFDLRCGGQGHVFEAWFGSTDDYEAQAARGLVSCPICGATEIDKAPMAPRVGAKGNQAGDMPPEAVKAALAGMAEAQKKMLEKSEHGPARPTPRACARRGFRSRLCHSRFPIRGRRIDLAGRLSQTARTATAP
jgi:hypothetical protein